jgi:hypothetical protein
MKKTNEGGPVLSRRGLLGAAAGLAGLAILKPLEVLAQEVLPVNTDSVEKNVENATVNVELLKTKISDQLQKVSIMVEAKFGKAEIVKERLDKFIQFKSRIDAGEELETILKELGVEPADSELFVKIFEEIGEMLSMFTELAVNLKIKGKKNEEGVYVEISDAEVDAVTQEMFNSFTGKTLNATDVNLTASSRGSSGSGHRQSHSSGPNVFFWYWYYHTFIAHHPAPSYSNRSSSLNYRTNVPSGLSARNTSVPSVGRGGFSGRGSSSS